MTILGPFLRAVRRAGISAVALTFALAPAAFAHGGNPRYRSVVHGITPSVPGLQVHVLDFDNRMQLFNTGHHTVLIYGYQHDPYARMLPDGTVEVNTRSPAYWVDQERFGNVPVPPSAGANKPPRWQVVNKAGEFDWHDHRMHWMSTSVPNQVTDQSDRTKIFDYRIPMRVDGKPETLTGTLFWVGLPGGSTPPWALISLGVFVVLAAAAVIVVRRRRGAEGAPGEDSKPAKEAW
jgi:hypothetical protein